MIYLWASATDNGRVRDHNEDAVYPSDMGAAADGFMAAVADGMGGHVGGEVASHVALDAAVDTPGDPSTRVQAGNLAVVDRIREQPKLAGMGTTMTLGLFSVDGQLEFGHVGDSIEVDIVQHDRNIVTCQHNILLDVLDAHGMGHGFGFQRMFR